jgi:hypothetical protein
MGMADPPHPPCLTQPETHETCPEISIHRLYHKALTELNQYPGVARQGDPIPRLQLFVQGKVKEVDQRPSALASRLPLHPVGSR